MATASEAPATMAEGPTQHTQNQDARFSPYQLRMLHSGINGNRVRNLRGMSHLEAWDVRRQLLRIFGFGGFSIETIDLDLVAEREKEQGGKSRWTVVYRAQVRLTLFTPDGRKITHFEDAAAGDAVNQPSLGDAHDLAMKTAVSQALKRCAVNLGDQFGLSLYNDGSQDAVVNFSAAHPPQDWKQTQPPQPEPVDPPVQPEPGTQPIEETPAAASSLVREVRTAAEGRDYLREANEAPDVETVRAIYRAAEAAGKVPPYLAQIAEVGRKKAALAEPGAVADPAPKATEHSKADHLNRLMKQLAESINQKNAMRLIQIKGDATKNGVIDEPVQGPDGVWTTMRKLIDDLIAEMNEQKRQSGNTDRGVA